MPETFLDDEEKQMRPQSLADFTGQRKALENLSVYIRGARRREEPLDHILFHGPPGLGKTTLSRIIAEELGVNLRAISAPSIAKPGDLAAVLVSLQPRDVLFIDEIHRLPNIVEELLYSAMEDYKVTILLGEGPASEPVEINIAPFTLVAATTRKGMLTQPMQDRFGIQFRLEYYEDDELAKIVKRAGSRLGEDVPEDLCLEIARRCRGTPRIAIKTMRRIRDFRQDMNCEYSSELIEECLERIGVDRFGFDELDRQYLITLRDQFNGGPVGLGTLATALSESQDTITTSIEPYLVRKGVIAVTNRGRIFSENAANIIENVDI